MARKVKKQVQSRLLSPQGRQGRAQFEDLPSQPLLKTLLGLLASPQKDLRWLAVSTLGREVAKVAELDLEQARNIMRRLAWSLNEESGAIGWGAPEAMAEAMAHSPGLTEDYLNIFISYLTEGHNYLEFEPLQRGVVWGLARLAQTRLDSLQACLAPDSLIPLLDSPDAAVRGLAALALGRLGHRQSHHKLQTMTGDQGQFELWQDYELSFPTVGLMAQIALAQLDAA